MKASQFGSTVKLPTKARASLDEQVSDVRRELSDALLKAGHFKKDAKYGYVRGYVEKVYDDTVIFSEQDDKYYACNYTHKDKSIVLGPKTEVERRTIYVPKGSK